MSAIDGAWPLRNVKYERLALAVASGKTMVQAMAEQGYATPNKHAWRYMKRPEIRARIDFLRRKTAEAVPITAADIVRQLAEDREFARERGAAAAAVTATMSTAKVLGLIVDKTEHKIKRLEDMTESELEEFLGETSDDSATRH